MGGTLKVGGDIGVVGTSPTYDLYVEPKYKFNFGKQVGDEKQTRHGFELSSTAVLMQFPADAKQNPYGIFAPVADGETAPPLMAWVSKLYGTYTLRLEEVETLDELKLTDAEVEKMEAYYQATGMPKPEAAEHKFLAKKRVLMMAEIDAAVQGLLAKKLSDNKTIGQQIQELAADDRKTAKVDKDAPVMLAEFFKYYLEAIKGSSGSNPLAGETKENYITKFDEQIASLVRKISKPMHGGEEALALHMKYAGTGSTISLGKIGQKDDATYDLDSADKVTAAGEECARQLAFLSDEIADRLWVDDIKKASRITATASDYKASFDNFYNTRMFQILLGQLDFRTHLQPTDVFGRYWAQDAFFRYWNQANAMLANASHYGLGGMLVGKYSFGSGYPSLRLTGRAGLGEMGYVKWVEDNEEATGYELNGVVAMGDARVDWEPIRDRFLASLMVYGSGDTTGELEAAGKPGSAAGMYLGLNVRPSDKLSLIPGLHYGTTSQGDVASEQFALGITAPYALRDPAGPNGVVLAPAFDIGRQDTPTLQLGNAYSPCAYGYCPADFPGVGHGQPIGFGGMKATPRAGFYEFLLRATVYNLFGVPDLEATALAGFVASSVSTNGSFEDPKMSPFASANLEYPLPF